MAVAVIAGLAISLTEAATPANAESPTARTIDANAIASGIVTRDGAPVGGVDVFAEVWPNQEVLDTLADDDTVPTVTAATAVTAADGWFTLSLNPAGLGSDYIGNGGHIDLALIVADAENEIEWNFSAQWIVSSELDYVWANPRVDNDFASSVAGEQAPTHLMIDIGTHAMVLEDGNHPAEWEDENGEPLGLEAGLEASRVQRDVRTMPDGEFTPNLGCLGWKATSYYERGREEQYVRATGLIYAPVKVRQETSARHSLGVALKLGASDATWSQSGTITRSVSAASTTNYGGTSSFVYNRVNYRQYRKICYYPSGPRAAKIEWRPYGFHSLNTRNKYTNRPTSWNKAANCEDYSSGTHTKRHGRNATYSRGVDLSTNVINVSANATFEGSNAVELSWTFSRSGGWLCGSTSDGWVDAPQAGAFVIP